MRVPAWLKRELRQALDSQPVEIMSERVIALQYEHVEDGRDYSHDFDAGVTMLAVGDDFIVLVRTDGKPISREFVT